ncbi:hypothetical protein F0562_012022 [Nyssa sinensis]|uniref:Uncharacterized protein n=1 Tax=Nyssa sinensis TaxID=561372 RepID=A0A5J4ZTE9_9ASTE|nr:hypothetical protein F0562_012022 [Nyssa sinensis]
MAPNNNGSAKKVFIKGAWTADEDRKLAEYIEIHGAKKWKAVATKSGLNRCGKSCRLRWLNYLRPNIKRGNISDEEGGFDTQASQATGEQMVIDCWETSRYELTMRLRTIGILI